MGVGCQAYLSFFRKFIRTQRVSRAHVSFADFFSFLMRKYLHNNLFIDDTGFFGNPKDLLLLRSKLGHSPHLQPLASQRHVPLRLRAPLDFSHDFG